MFFEIILLEGKCDGECVNTLMTLAGINNYCV